MHSETSNRAVAQKGKMSPQKAKEELVQTSFRLPRSRWRKLHELSLDERSSVQAIIIRALESEFSRRGITF